MPVPMPGALSVASMTELVFSCFSTPMADVHIDVWCIATLRCRMEAGVRLCIDW